MKRIAFALAAAILLITSAATAAEYGNATVSEVTSVYDGDTFRANIEGWPDVVGRRMPVRLAGADTPELRGKCPAEIVQARAAKRFTVSQLRSARTITLKNISRGKYFRLVAQVLVDGRDLSELLIARGLARPYDGGHRAGWCAYTE